LALGMWAAATALGQGIGPLIGGGLTDAIDWRAIFAFDVVLLAAGLFACVLLARKNIVPEDAERHGGIDYLGAGLMMIALVALTLAMTRGQRLGWGSAEIVGLLVIFVIASIGFVAREWRTETPLFRLSFFREASYVAAAAGTFVSGFGIFGLIYYFNVFFQSPEGPDYTAFQAGLALLPCTMLFFVGSIGFPRLLTNYDLHWPTTLGMVLLACGFWFLSHITVATAYADVSWRLALIGLGFGLTFGLLPRVGLRDLPDADAGQGSGVINVCLYIGFTFGIAACGVVVNALRHDIVEEAVQALASAPANPRQVVRDLAHGSNSVIERTLKTFDGADAAVINAALARALEAGFAGAMTLLALTAVIGALLCGLLLRHRS
ncbi:MAG: MFS transporter, partial [Pseudomonadota bacterium]